MIQIFKYFLFSRGLFLFFAIIAPFFIPLASGYLGNQISFKQHYIFWVWANFDGRHYIDIANTGYRNTNFAFFPFYPLLINKLEKVLVIPPIYIGISISLLSFLIALYFIYKIIRLDYSENIAKISIFLICFYPLSFFYNSVYPDSLFLLFSTASFYFARRNNWLLSGIFGMATTLTRLSGLALIPALFLEWIMQNRKTKRNSWINVLHKFLRSEGFICLVITGLGFIFYLAYLEIFFGNWLLFQKSFSAWRQDQLVLLPQVLFRYLKIFLFVDRGLLIYWIAALEFICFIFYIFLSIYVWKKVRNSYGMFMIVLLLLVTFTGTLAGTPRYLLHLFPAFLGMGIFLMNKKLWVFFSILVSMLLGFLFTSLFTRGYFIT